MGAMSLDAGEGMGISPLEAPAKPFMLAACHPTWCGRKRRSVPVEVESKERLKQRRHPQTRYLNLGTEQASRHPVADRHRYSFLDLNRWPKRDDGDAGTPLSSCQLCASFLHDVLPCLIEGDIFRRVERASYKLRMQTCS